MWKCDYHSSIRCGTRIYLVSHFDMKQLQIYVFLRILKMNLFVLLPQMFLDKDRKGERPKCAQETSECLSHVLHNTTYCSTRRVLQGKFATTNLKSSHQCRSY